MQSPDWMIAKSSIYTPGKDFHNDIKLAISTFQDPLSPTQLTYITQFYAAIEASQNRINSFSNQELQGLVWLNRTQEAIRLANSRIDPGMRFEGLLAVHKASLEKDGTYNFHLSDLSQLTKL